jgi:hypothetical protein
MIALLLPAAAAVTGCGPSVPRVDPRPVEGVHIECEPADAQLYLDDKYLGSVKGLDSKPLMLGEGDHRLEIRKDGYFSHFAEIKVVRGVRQRLKVKLRAVPF